MRWTCKSTRILAKELADQGHPASHNAVYDLLTAQGFTLQTNRKLMQSGKQHPDRNGQFANINDTVLRYINRGLPVISVDCKKILANIIMAGLSFQKKAIPSKFSTMCKPVVQHIKGMPEVPCFVVTVPAPIRHQGQNNGGRNHHGNGRCGCRK